jgi:hypothetical protein
MRLTPLTLFLACMMVARNQRILAAWQARQDEDAHRAAVGQPPRRRARHRRELAGAVEPRYPSFKGIMAARRKLVEQLTAGP